jgi:hypothetical protein
MTDLIGKEALGPFIWLQKLGFQSPNTRDGVVKCATRKNESEEALELRKYRHQLMEY